MKERFDKPSILEVEKGFTGKREWLGRNITPLSLDQVHKIMKEYYETVLDFDEGDYRTNRGIKQLLNKDSKDYAKLPWFNDQNIFEVFKFLKNGKEWLDLGCGTGTFIKEILEVNPKIKAVGFDARTWANQENIPELIIGDIDNVDKSMFVNHSEGFDLVTSASVFYHLPDYWSTLGRAINILKPGGLFTISTICRPMYYPLNKNKNSEPIDNENGELELGFKRQFAKYFHNRNIFNIKGNLISIADVIKTINLNNPGIVINYKTVSKKDTRVSGTLHFGGGFFGKKFDNSPIDFSSIFYCYYPDSNKITANDGYNDVSFIVARSKAETKSLIREDFVSVQERFQ